MAIRGSASSLLDEARFFETCCLDVKGDFMQRLMSILGATALFTVAAAAAPAGFTAAFPCQTKVTNQTVDAGKIKIPVANHSCATPDALYSVVASTYPKGFIAKKTLKGAFADAVAGSAANVKGTIRADKTITLAGVAGHDALIDIKADKAVAHLRVFFVGDKAYQVLFVGPAGQENGKAATAFLDSFKLEK